MSNFIIKDTGHRKAYSTGAMRDRAAGKGLPTLRSPISNRRVNKHFETGALKYDLRNWEKGMPVIEFINSAQRHLDAYLEGDRGEDHLAAAEWNVHCGLHTEEMVKRGLHGRELLEGLQRYFPSTCKDHPKYKGIRKPTSKCVVCQHIYEWTQYYNIDPSNWS